MLGQPELIARIWLSRLTGRDPLVDKGAHPGQGLAVVAPAEVDVPDVQPGFSAPWLQGVQVIVSYLFATGLLVLLAMLIIAGCALAFRGLASDRMRTWAGENIIWIFIATAVSPDPVYFDRHLRQRLSDPADTCVYRRDRHCIAWRDVFS